MTKLMGMLENSAHGTAQIHFLPSGVELFLSDVWRNSEKVARWLNARVGQGGSVAALLSNTPESVASVYGIWRSGNNLVSLPHPSRGQPVDRYLMQLLSIVEMTGAEQVLLDAQYRHMLPEEITADLPFAVDTFQAAHSGGPRSDVTGDGDLIQFTSGSISSPKGVVLSQEAIATNIGSLIEVLEPRPGDTPCSWLPLSHDMGFIGMFLTPMVGLTPGIFGSGTFVLMTPEYFMAQPSSWVQACADFGVTITTAPNFAFELASRTRGWVGDVDLSSLRVCISGAERVSAETLRKFSAAYADAKFNPTAICPAYGMAEATLAVTMVKPADTWRSLLLDRGELGDGLVVPSTGAGVEYVGNGAAIPNMEIRIMARDGDVGEVQLRGPSLLSDYMGAELELTEDGWLPTRDLGFQRDGELFLVGRSDDTIIVGGKNHYAADIEMALRHDWVREGCLAAVPLDEGFALVTETRRELSSAEQTRLCRELAVAAAQGAGIKPATVSIVPRGSLPKTPSGKLQRTRIADGLRTGELETTASIAIGG